MDNFDPICDIKVTMDCNSGPPGPPGPSYGLNPNNYGAIGNGDVANMALDTHGWQVVIDLSAATGVPVVPGAGTWIIDGYKGDHSEWSPTGTSTHGGLIMAPGVVIRGAGVGKTILRNGANPWRSVIRIRSGTVSIRDLTIDGSVDTCIPVMLEGGIESPTGGSVRGEVIIFEGGGAVTWFDLKNLEVKNSGHYGIGLQNVSIDAGEIDSIVFTNIGGDCIDGKDYTTGDYKRNIYISNIVATDGCGRHYPQKYGPTDDGHNNQTVIDMCSGMHLHGCFIMGLDSYNAASIGNCGVRGRAQLDSNFRSGSKGCTASMIRIASSKLANEGSSTVKRIIGIDIGDDNFHLSDAVVTGCFYGARVVVTSDGVPLSGSLVDVVVTDCTGAGVDPAYGLQVGAGCKGIFGRNIITKRCERGARISGTRCDIALRIEDSKEVQLDTSDASLSQNSLLASFGRDNVVPSIGDYDPAIAPLTALDSTAGVSPKGYILTGDLNVMQPRRSYLNLVSMADDVLWIAPDDIAGGIQVLLADSSGPGPGIRAAIRARCVGPSGAGMAWDFSTASPTDNDVVSFQVSSTRNISKLPFELKVYTIATLPAAVDFAACLVYVSNAVGGKHIVVSNGVAWKYMDGTVV